jgi:hypothetical protein
MRHTALKVGAVLALAVAAWSVGVTAQKNGKGADTVVAAGLPDRIWRDPGDIATLDLTSGSGGRARAPDTAGTFTFVSEDRASSSPKFEVADAQGVEWKVKLGPEAQPETAASRFLWAAGYFADEDYYVAELTVTGLPTLRRGQKLVSAGGVVHGARLERKRTAVDKVGDWDWFDNPFVGQRELNGLRVMMSLLNNWDLKQINNAIYAVDGEHHYAISDGGATFGNTGSVMTRSKGIPKDYEESKFIAKITPDFVDFVLHSRPFFLGVFSASRYEERTRMEKITRHIPRADARWLGQRLSMLTEDQIRDGFRAAGYDAADVETLTRTFRLRIAALEAL